MTTMLQIARIAAGILIGEFCALLIYVFFIGPQPKKGDEALTEDEWHELIRRNEEA